MAPESPVMGDCMATCGTAAVRLLEEYGVTTVFGIPGVHTLECYRGLSDSPIRHITTRHEQGAGFMAHGYARVTGRPGVCLVISGPGLTNITTAMGQAYGDSVPMLVLSGAGETAQLSMGHGTTHELRRQTELAAQVSAFSHTVLAPGQLPEVFASAFTSFYCDRPRPVHIEIPFDIAKQPLEFEPRAWPIPGRPSPQESAIDEAARLLASADSPVLIYGGGTVDAGASARDLVELLGAPTALSTAAKGVLPKGHPLSLGSTLQFKPVQALVEEADVVLAVGTEFGETDTQLFGVNLKITGRLIRIDIEARQLVRTLQPSLPIMSDADQALRALASAVRGLRDSVSVHNRSGVETVRRTREALKAFRRPEVDAYVRLFNLIQRALPEVVLVGDSTQPAYEADHLLETSEPRTYMTASMAFGTLGFGLPAAIGAKLGAWHRPVVCLIGDAGMQFTLPELATAVQERIPILVLIWKNDGYEEIRFHLERHGIPYERFDVDSPDFVMAAKAFGCHAAAIKSGRELEELLARLTVVDRPIVAEIDEDALSR